MAPHHRKSGLPPRGPGLAGRSYLLEFDVDCGELSNGHRFIARGLSDDGISNGPDDADIEVQVFSLEYELTPGVPASESDFFRHLVGISYSADVDLPWEPVDGGAMAPFEGGPTTHGSRGSWPLPEDARRLTFLLFAVPPGERWANEQPAGRLTVDLDARSAEWAIS